MIRINYQPAEKQRTESHLEVHSIFYTIQGEGPFAGQPAVFIRLAGCNLQCPGCDTDYTSKRSVMLPQDIVAEIMMLLDLRSRRNPRPLVVITGGEPFRQDIGKLVRMLASKEFRVQIETNGTIARGDLPWNSITVVCSPKAGKISPHIAPHIDALKYVLDATSVNHDDGLPLLALGHSAAPQVARPPEGFTGTIYLQPMDTGDALLNHLNLEACIISCMKFGYTLQVQIHKIINME